jgi:putative transposase
MRSVYRYHPRPERDQEVIDALLELAHRKPEMGFGKLFHSLRRRGHPWNHKRVYRNNSRSEAEQKAERQAQAAIAQPIASCGQPEDE